MAIGGTEIRFMFDRMAGLWRRGMTSLRTRGWQATWQRVAREFRTVPAAQRDRLYLPPRTAFAPFRVPGSPEPRASIVIPVYNQFAHTLACLRAIAAHPPAAAFEVIVVDDGSSDETATALPRIEGVRFHRRTSNGGFIAACNDGASRARGAFVVFLNNDTLPQPGWLDALLGTFDAVPDAGLVGAQLIYPDGRLQEAGGIVFSDGGGWNYGRFESPEDPRFACLRDADYCSGAAIAIPRAVFESLGGFDTRYSPAYYEDTDLAFAVRDAGHRVLYQPAAQVVHLEGVTSGTDLTQGPKAYQVRNRGVFAGKWRAALTAQPAPGTSADAAAWSHGPGPHRVLIIDGSLPRPDLDSASLRLVNLMRVLGERARVTFLPADLAFDASAAATLQHAGVEVWHGPHARTLPGWLRGHAGAFDTVMVSRHHLMRELLPLLRRHAPNARVLFDSVDLHYLRERRAAELAGDAALRRAAERTRTLELDVIARSDATLVVSDVERALLERDAPGAQVHVLSNVHRVSGPGRTFAEREGLVFVGGFRHPPNVDAVSWFAAEVLPLVHERLPDVAFHCIGAEPPPAVAALASRQGVVVHGHVPDITPYMDGARIALAPLRFGAGVKGKINLSMAHGQPVVATSCAVEGMHLQAGEDVLVADTAEAFAEAIVRLYGDESLWRRLASNGLANVEQHFSMDAAREVVRRVFL